MFHCYRLGGLSVGMGFADFELDEVRWVVAGVTGGAEFAFGVVHGPLEAIKGEIAQGIGA